MPKNDLLHRANSLDFEPLRPWPRALPTISYDGYLLTDFRPLSTEPAKPLFEVHSTEVSFGDAFVSCYPVLSLPELARLYKGLEPSPFFGSFAAIAERCCGLKSNETLISVLEKLVQTPRPFQAWVSQRGLAPRDLAILNSLGLMDLLALAEDIFLTIARLELTRSQGAQALEKALELFLLKTPLSEILEPAVSADAWLKALEKARKPQAWKRQGQAQAKMETLPWPAYIQARWLRQGDEGQVEVKFQFSSNSDFKRKIEGLEIVRAALEAQSVAP
jgi:hypothetical protein